MCSLAAATPVASSVVALSIVASLRWELVQLLALVVAHLATLTSIHAHVRRVASHLRSWLLVVVRTANIVVTARIVVTVSVTIVAAIAVVSAVTTAILVALAAASIVAR